MVSKPIKYQAKHIPANVPVLFEETPKAPPAKKIEAPIVKDAPEAPAKKIEAPIVKDAPEAPAKKIEAPVVKAAPEAPAKKIETPVEHKV